MAAKTDLSTTKPELRGLATSSQTYDDMLQILGQIEQLQSIQERLDTRITEKRFLTAVDILQDGLRLIRRSEMDSIGALADLRSYLTNQETSLKDILVEELHSHLYLKSPYCQDRWKAYATVQSPGSDTTWTPPGMLHLANAKLVLHYIRTNWTQSYLCLFGQDGLVSTGKSTQYISI